MRLYLDTAYIAKCYINEPERRQVKKLVEGASGLYSSALSLAEMACVFQRQVREGKLTSRQATEWQSRFHEDVRDGVWMLLPVSQHLLFRVASLVGGMPSEAYLRGADAVHLMTAVDAGFTEIWSNDRRLLAAAPYFGLQGKSV